MPWRKKIDLSYINLKNENLTNANLDMAYMPGAMLNGCNLTGCNLSESNLEHSTLINTSLYNTCLSYSRLRQCNFTGAAFGATLIDGSDMRECIFSTLSCFDLDFHLTHSIAGTTYITPEETRHSMSIPPVILKGILNTPIIILDDTTKIGTHYFSTKVIRPFLKQLYKYIEIAPQQDNTRTLIHNEHAING